MEEWLGESEDHQREFRQLKRRIELGSKRYKYGVFDPRQAIQKVKFPAKRHYLRILPVAAFYHCFNYKRVMVLELNRHFRKRFYSLGPGKRKYFIYRIVPV